MVEEASKISDFHNVNIPNINWPQLNQRLRCVTTEEQVEDILGTPEGALGSESITSLIPSRKKRAQKVHNFGDSSSSQNSMVDKQPFYNKGVQQNLDVTPEQGSLPPARQKALFKGRYFPSFGLLCSPLMGTEIFPLSPKMEKLHFAVAADMPLDHYDGEPQQQFLDDIKEYMKPVFDAYHQSNRDRYLHRFKNQEFDNEWKLKFPYASHRFHEGNAIRGQVGTEEVFKVNLESHPGLFDNYKENINPDGLSERHGKGSKLRHEQLQVISSKQASQKESRQVGFLASQMKIESAEALMNADEFGRKFEKFLALAKLFFAKGHKSIKHPEQVPMRELHSLYTYEQFENWIFQVKDNNSVPNATHVKCLTTTPWNEQFSVTQRLKVEGWLTTLFKFDRFKLISRKVKFYFLRLYKKR